MTQPENKSYEWSTLYEEKTAKVNSSQNRSSLWAWKLFFILLAAGIVFYKLDLKDCVSLEACLPLLQSSRALGILAVLFIFVLVCVSPIERMIFKKDDVTFLKKIPNDEELSFRSLRVEFSQSQKKILFTLCYSVGPRIPSHLYKKSISVLRRQITDATGSQGSSLEELKRQYPPRNEEILKLEIDEKFIHAMGLIFTLDQIMDRFDSEEINQIENKHLALLLQLIFYGKREDMRQYLSILQEADASNERHLSEQIHFIYLHFATKYDFMNKPLS